MVEAMHVRCLVNVDLWLMSRWLPQLHTTVTLTDPPVPQTDIIAAMVIVWRVRGKTVRSVLCQYCVQQLCTVQCTHIMNRTNSCLLVRFSFSVVTVHVC